MSAELLTSWMSASACLVRPDLPWTSDTASMPSRRAKGVVAAMTRVCSRCPVLDRCAAFVVEAHVTGGFWAGRDRDAFGPAPLDSTDAAVQLTLPGLDPVVAA